MSSSGSRPASGTANTAANADGAPARGPALTVRLPLVVRTVSATLAGAVPARASVTWPAAQANDSAVAAGVMPKRATDCDPSRAQVHVPAVIAASRHSATGAAGGGAGRATGAGRVGSGAGSRGWHAASTSSPAAAERRRGKSEAGEAFAIAALLCDPAHDLNPRHCMSPR